MADLNTIGTLIGSDIKKVNDKVVTHEADTTNPHSVTKVQVGLSNVDNTSDISKPISTAQQAAFDLKFDKNGGTITGNVLIEGADASLTINDSSGSPTDQGVVIRGESIDTNLPNNEGIGIVIEQSPTNGAPDTTPAVITTGEFYAESDKHVFHDNYHPTADKLTTSRTITVNGDQTGSVAFDGSGSVTLTLSNVAANLLSDLKTVDGSESGLDADLLDGQHGSYYQDASNINAGTISDARLPATISSDISGTAATATKLTTARTIALSGDVSGSTTFDGSGNVTISAAVANDSHTHDGRYYTETESNSRFAYKGGTSGQNFSAGNITLNGDNFIKFGPGTPGSDDAHIEWGGSSNAGHLRISTSDDNGTEPIQFGDYDTTDRGGVFTQWLTMNRSGSTFSSTVTAPTFNGTLNGNASTATNADKLDGLNSTQFVRSDATASMSGSLSVNNELYYTSWIRNNGASASGLYWQNSSNPGYLWHIYPQSQADMTMRTGSGNGGIKGTIVNDTARGYVHWTTNNEIGFLNNSRSWILRADSNKNVQVYGAVTATAFNGNATTATTASHLVVSDHTANDTEYYLMWKGGSGNTADNQYTSKADLTYNPANKRITTGRYSASDTANGAYYHNDASGYLLYTATNWGIYWDTITNSYRFRGSGNDKFTIDLDNGNTAQTGNSSIEGDLNLGAAQEATIRYNNIDQSIDFIIN